MAKSYEGFSEDERAAMKEYAAELKTSARRGSGAKKAEAEEKDCEEKIAALSGTDRAIGEKLHAIVKTSTELSPKTWYGMPAYARDGKVVVFFKPASKFKVRYAEVGFNEWAALDSGDMWPTVFAVTDMTPAIENKLATLVKKAARPL